MPSFAATDKDRTRRTAIVHVVTDHFSGPGSAIVPVCVSVCVRTMTFEPNDV